MRAKEKISKFRLSHKLHFDLTTFPSVITSHTVLLSKSYSNSANVSSPISQLQIVEAKISSAQNMPYSLLLAYYKWYSVVNCLYKVNGQSETHH